MKHYRYCRFVTCNVNRT